MKRISFLLAFIFILSFSYLNSQTLFVPGGFSTTGLGSSSTSGNVGIGTPNPSFRCDLNLGTVTSNSNIGFNVFGDATGNIGYSGYNLQLNNSTANASGYLRLARTASTAFLGLELGSQSRDGIRFLTHATSPVEVMRIDATGNVGIGVGGIGTGNNPIEKIDVNGNLLLRNFSNASNTGAYIHFSSYSGSHPGPKIRSSLAYASGSVSKSKLILSSYWEGYKDELTLMNGNVGVGTSQPGFKLDIEGFGLRLRNSAISSGSYTTFRVQGGEEFENGLEIDFFGNPNFPSLEWTYGAGYGGAAIMNVNPKPLVLGTSNLPRLYISGNGNILVGKTTQTNTAYKLDVAGKIRANEIVVNTTGADFVFEPTYKLRPLSELETFIKEHKHLPEIAPAKEMQENGVSAGEMQTKLLQKVEELTLYVIEKDKEIAEQHRMLSELKKEIEILKIENKK